MDRPYERLVVVRGVGGVGRYNREDENLKDYLFTNFDRATPLEDFGISIKELNGVFYCLQYKESVAKYHDGRIRLWQGAREFIVF